MVHGGAALATSKSTLQLCIARALDLAVRYGGIGGDHHKSWVIDQMVRALTGCEGQTDSPKYSELVACAKSGEDGPDTYAWEVGIAP